MRRFIIASDASAYKYLSKLPPNCRHLYEIIPEGRACNLYFDIEYKRQLNQGLEGDAMVAFLVEQVLAALPEAVPGLAAGVVGGGGAEGWRACRDVDILELGKVFGHGFPVTSTAGLDDSFLGRTKSLT